MIFQRRTDIQADRQTPDRQKERHTENRQTDRQRDRETTRQRDRETERQRDRETERQRDRETERQRDREWGENCGGERAVTKIARYFSEVELVFHRLKKGADHTKQISIFCITLPSVPHSS